MTLTSELKAFTEELGLDVVRITSAKPCLDAAERIKEQVRRGLRPEWKIADIDNFCNPKRFLPEAKSVIVAAECYLTSEPTDMSKPGEPHGKIARYTWRNYYRDVEIKLRMVADFLREKSEKDFASNAIQMDLWLKNPWRKELEWAGMENME